MDGYSLQKVADIYGLSIRTIYQNFKKHNLERRTNQENSRVYELNHRFFETIDTEEKAYWLGFMYADGYISKLKNSNTRKVGLSIGIEDRSHLEKFNKCLESNYPIREYTVGSSGYKIGAKYCRLIIASPDMYGDLVRQGCVEHKTDVLKPPEHIESHLIRHFIRGYVDGDGSITKANRKHYGYEYGLNIVGTDDMLTFIANNFLENGATTKPLNLEKRKKEQSVSYIRYGGNNNSEILLDYLYKDSKIYLDRKYERYLELKLQNCRTQ